MKKNRSQLAGAKNWVQKKLGLVEQEQLGAKTNYNLFLHHPWLRMISKGHFVRDEDPEFLLLLRKLRRQNLSKAVILGNAPCLSELSGDHLEELHSRGYLSIGINRSIYTHQTDILLWSDLKAITDALKRRAIARADTTVIHARLERDHRLKASADANFQYLHQFWSTHKNFSAWPKQKLYMFRNSAVCALHLCYRLGIRDVVMVGFGFDNREYFYKTNRFSNASTYEVISQERLDENCGGYTTQRIVKEVIEYLISEEGFRIRFNGDSQFLRTVQGIEPITIDSLMSED